GELKLMLGIEVEISEKEISISQSKFVDQILNKFGMSNCNKSLVPRIDKTTTDSPIFDDATLYRQAVGSLSYLANNTRPDISYAVNQAARKMKEPTEADWINVKRIMRYLQGTRDYKITYYQEKPPEIEGYTDASYAENQDGRKSTTGYVYFKNGGPISWRTTKQEIIAISSTEAEYIALTTSAKECI